MVQAAAGGGPGEMPEEKEGRLGTGWDIRRLCFVAGERIEGQGKTEGAGAMKVYPPPPVPRLWACSMSKTSTESSACQKQAESSASHFSFLNSGKLMKAICLLNSTLSNQNTLSWAQIHNKIYLLLHVWYLKNNGNHNISLKAATTALQVTLGNFYVNQSKKSFLLCFARE